ncbi:hypothetical protein TWF696_005338 [Orbilia brochopaga]|uniref:Uncharacterized protein n=1 Tax=Orbilia brochopaga TaxID=3140254 RepID=A0AAV9V1G3_9PEZI
MVPSPVKFKGTYRGPVPRSNDISIFPHSEKTYIHVLQKLDIREMEGAGPLDIMARRQGSVEGYVFSDAVTYRYYVWLTITREIEVAEVVSGKRFRTLRTAKVPFLLWFGNAESYLSPTTAKYFFGLADTERTHIDVSVDGDEFVFHTPDEENGNNYMSILGRDFLDSRFKRIDADYNSRILRCRRRQTIRDDEETLDWIRERDNELERYLQADEETGEYDDKGPFLELHSDDNESGDEEEEDEKDDFYELFRTFSSDNTVPPGRLLPSVKLEPDGPVKQEQRAPKPKPKPKTKPPLSDRPIGCGRKRCIHRLQRIEDLDMGPPKYSASARTFKAARQTAPTRMDTKKDVRARKAYRRALRKILLRRVKSVKRLAMLFSVQ